MRMTISSSTLTQQADSFRYQHGIATNKVTLSWPSAGKSTLRAPESHVRIGAALAWKAKFSRWPNILTQDVTSYAAAVGMVFQRPNPSQVHFDTCLCAD